MVARKENIYNMMIQHFYLLWRWMRFDLLNKLVIYQSTTNRNSGVWALWLYFCFSPNNMCFRCVRRVYGDFSSVGLFAFTMYNCFSTFVSTLSWYCDVSGQWPFASIDWLIDWKWLTGGMTSRAGGCEPMVSVLRDMLANVDRSLLLTERLKNDAVRKRSCN